MNVSATKKKITLLDYGVGNLYSVTRAFQHLGAQVILSHDPDEIFSSEALVLPGVGAFAVGMAGLEKYGLVEVIRAYARTGRPLLGICLGMQMLFTKSFEFGEHSGLDLIEGDIVPITSLSKNPEHLKVPHIGWSSLKTSRPSAWDASILKSVERGESCYFVHSFGAVPRNPEHRLADAEYEDCTISAVVAKENIYGCQFHPEKSGATGLKIIEGFLEI